MYTRNAILTEMGHDLSDLPPSAKLVYKVLEYDGPMTQKELVAESMLSARTVRYALDRLGEREIVEEDIYFADARQSLYRLSTPECSCESGAEAGTGSAG
ncbi:MAG: ArsR family transcriptional regulator [Halobacteriaceae archaeon]